jgi:hypothetical protein
LLSLGNTAQTWRRCVCAFREAGEIYGLEVELTNV